MRMRPFRSALLLAALSFALTPALPDGRARAAQGGGFSVASPLPAGSLPVPPQPEPAPAFEAAPTPNPDVERPRDRQASASHAEIAPNLFTEKEQHRGDGFVAGSIGRYDQNRQRVTPGVNLTVPLQ
jgi:hypothetical protein